MNRHFIPCATLHIQAQSPCEGHMPCLQRPRKRRQSLFQQPLIRSRGMVRVSRAESRQEESLYSAGEGHANATDGRDPDSCHAYGDAGTTYPPPSAGMSSGGDVTPMKSRGSSPIFLIECLVFGGTKITVPGPTSCDSSPTIIRPRPRTIT